MVSYIYYSTGNPPAVVAIQWILWILSLAAAIWVIVDAARRPDWQYQSTGQSKGLWIGLGIGSVVLCCFCVPAWIVAGVYLFAIRPKLTHATQLGYGASPMGGYMPPGAYPTGGFAPPPPPGGGYPPPPPPGGGYPPPPAPTWPPTPAPPAAPPPAAPSWPPVTDVPPPASPPPPSYPSTPGGAGLPTPPPADQGWGQPQDPTPPTDEPGSSSY